MSLHMNRYERKQRHKCKLKKRSTPNKYHSYEDFLAHADGEIWSLEKYWGQGERWWNESNGSGSYKVSWKKQNHDKEQNFWRQILNGIDPDEDLGFIPILRRGFKFGDVYDLW